MKIIFMGTPEFAAPALNALIQSEHEVVAVYTQPPKPAGRGYDLRKSPIHELAENNNIIVRTPESLKNKEVQEEFKNLGADVAAVAAYGLILPQEILKGCPFGCLNIHPSLLPRWRGASPIQRAVIAGDEETGVCIMQMDEGLDTGDVLVQEKIKMPESVTAGELHDRLADIGSKLLIATIDNIKELKPKPQANKGTTYAEKLLKKDGEINWNLSAKEIDCLIRGVSPWPGAYFTFENKKIKIISAEWEGEEVNQEPGRVLDDSLTISCKKGTIRPIKVQKQDKNATDVESFLRGTKIPEGTILS